jgi:hypothetical protein
VPGVSALSSSSRVFDLRLPEPVPSELAGLRYRVESLLKFEICLAAQVECEANRKRIGSVDDSDRAPVVCHGAAVRGEIELMPNSARVVEKRWSHDVELVDAVLEAQRATGSDDSSRGFRSRPLSGWLVLCPSSR